MTRRADRCSRTVTPLGIVGLCLATCVLGCGKSPPPASVGQGADPPAKAEPAPAVVRAAPAAPLPPGQSFKEATTEEVIESEGYALPPLKTKAGKVVGKLYEMIAGKDRDGIGGLWNQVVFVSPAGKKLKYTATIKTALGDIVIEMRPDLAPNHVRNF